MKSSLYSLALVLSIFLSACSFLEFSPNKVDVPAELRSLTSKNLGRIQHLQNKDTLRIAITGDTQRYLADSRDLVNAVNSRNDIDLLIHTGDFTDFGINREYIWMAEIFNELDVPWFVAVGNHDLVGNGPQIYEIMFGNEDFHFDLEHFRFLFYDSNSREAGFPGTIPDVNWIKNRADSTRRIIAVTHIPTYNHDFDQNLTESYQRALDEELNIALKINGHHHDYGSGMLEGTDIRYINSMSCSKREFILLELTRYSQEHTRVTF